MLDPASEVADPSTSAERLAALAAQYPELGSRIAAHPNCYPGLQEWITLYVRAQQPRPVQQPVVAQSAASASPSPPPAEPAGKFWTKTKVIVSGTIAFLGAVTGVISVIPILTRDATNFSHLQISAEPISGSATEWAIPEGSLDAGFPADAAPCGPEQLDWLKSHAQPMQRGFMVNARNVASEGAMLALTEFRSSETGAEDRGPLSVRLVCDPSGVAPEDVYYAKLAADDPRREAVHVRAKADAAPNSSPEMPVAFNLAPGESGKIPFELFSRNPASGHLEVTVRSRDEDRVYEIEGSDFKLPALLFGGEMYLFTGSDGLVCLQAEAGVLRTCTLDDVQHELGIAQR